MASLSSENETPTVESEGDSQGGTETLRPRPVRPPPPYRPSNNTSNSPEEPSFLSSELQDALNSPTLPTEQPPPYTPPTSVYTPPTTMLVPHEVQPLLESQVRWFYRDPNVYWKPFSGHDSLKLERQYQKLTAASGNTDPNEWTVRVHGEMSDANLQDMICESVFWKSPAQRILRGTWFEVTSEKKWYPLEKEDAEAVEGAHCDKSWRIRADTALKALSEAGQMSQAGKVEWNKIFLKNHNVVWYGDEEISMIKTDFSSRMMQKIGFAGGNKLVRGYKDSAMFEDGRQPPVKHFVFCTHGIGQLYDASEDVKSVVKSTTDLKNTCTELANKHFKHQWEGGRVEFLPVEWRSMLTLDRGIVETITPQGVRQLRDMANSTILDVIYYLSPVFHAEIIESVRFQLNKHFLHILERFPNFTVDGGKFSLFAHSLGSVIVYDILAECKPDPAAEDVGVDTDEKECLEIQLAKARAKVSELEDKMSALGKIPRSHRKKMGLKFPVEHLFAVGSPLGVFLAMRDAEKHVTQDHRSAQDLLPFSVCKRIHNIYHPSDCVAYRLEPLLSSVYQQVKPVKMDSSGSGVSQNMMGHASGPRPQDTTMLKKAGFLSSIFGSKNVAMVMKDPPPDKILTDDSSLPADSRLVERLDFCLKEAAVQNAYLSSLFAHTGYWTNQDVGLFVLCQIYNYKV